MDGTICTACDHSLRRHHIQYPVFDQRAEFLCDCGCAVDGGANFLRNDVETRRVQCELLSRH